MPPTNQEPTPAEWQSLLEKCGFKHIQPEFCTSCKRQEPSYWLKEGVGRRLTDDDVALTPGNLLKWAVPAVNKKGFYLNINQRPSTEWIVWTTNHKIGAAHFQEHANLLLALLRVCQEVMK